MRAARRAARYLADPTGAVASLVILGAALRLPTLGAKSFWRDEAYTLSVVRLDFGAMLGAIADNEATPPLYYILAWLWIQVLGSGEAAIRSLSALLGVATIGVAYLVGRELVSARAGIAAAGLVAVSPLLVWYSQEARSYALLVLLGGLSFLFFVRALRGSGRRALAWWALTSSLALSTHYFAFYLVGVEGAWLFVAARPRRATVAAGAFVGLVGAALIPLLREQRGDGRRLSWIAEKEGIWMRAVELPGLLLVGFETPAPLVVAGVAAVLAAVCMWPLVRQGSRPERRAAALAGGVGGLAIAAPIVFALGGLDYFFYRNVLGSAVPLAALLAVGVGASRPSRAAVAAAVGLGLLSIGVVLATTWEPKYHREEWRGVAAALRAPDVDRAVVMTPDYGRSPLTAYMPRTAPIPAPGRPVREVVIVAVARADATALAPPRVPRPSASAPPPAPAFRLVERHDAKLFSLVRYRTARPVRLSEGQLAAAAIEGPPTVLFQPGAG